MIQETIENDLKAAQKQKEVLSVSVLRLALAAIHNQEIEKKEKLTDEEVVKVLRNEVKQRKESIEAFRKGKREELVSKEEEELKILSKYLPQELSVEELEKITSEVISSPGACPLSDFGKVMGQVMERVKGRGDGAVVAKVVKDRLAGK